MAAVFDLMAAEGWGEKEICTKVVEVKIKERGVTIRRVHIHCCLAKRRSPTNVNNFVNGGPKRKIVDIV